MYSKGVAKKWISNSCVNEMFEIYSFSIPTFSYTVSLGFAEASPSCQWASQKSLFELYLYLVLRHATIVANVI